MDLSSEIYHALLPAFMTIVLGLPATALGAIDGVAEATANFAKLASGRLSDRSRRRKPWIIAGYGLAALSKPLFPLATSAPTVMARAVRRPHRQGHSRQPARRDDRRRDRRPRSAAARSACRQALDTVGALLAPIVAIGLMAAGSRATSARCSGSRSSPPRRRSCSPGWRCASRSSTLAPLKRSPFFAGFRELDKRHQAAARRRLPVRARALFGRLPDPQGNRGRPVARRCRR